MWVFPAKLGHAKSRPKLVLNGFGENEQIILAEPIQSSGFSPGTFLALVI